MAGPALDLCFVHSESLAVYGQLGLNPPAIVGARITDTYGAYAVGFTAGAGYRYPSLSRILGTHSTSGVELRLGAIAAGDDPDTYPLVLMSGLVPENHADLKVCAKADTQGRKAPITRWNKRSISL